MSSGCFALHLRFMVDMREFSNSFSAFHYLFSIYDYCDCQSVLKELATMFWSARVDENPVARHLG